MAYIHKKNIGGKTYYTLRISARKNGKIIVKDLHNLGSDISKIEIDKLEKKYKKEIRKSYKTIKKFLETNKYLENAGKKKHKKNYYLTKEELSKIEAAKEHYSKKFLKLPEKTRREILEQFLLRFAVNSTSIEGNTITLKEAAKLFSEGTVPKNRTVREVYDLTNTRKAFFELMEKKPSITLKLIEETHDKLLENIDERKGFRDHDIHILGQPFKPSPARYIKDDLKILVEWYKKEKKRIHPVVLATLFHHKFENIHPFSDGNGRTGRMIMNHILIKHSYPPIVINNFNRKEYLEALNKADKAIKKNLEATENPDYTHLVKFTAKQLEQSYWDIFLH